ncbi:MAG: hypothetical protein JSR33_05515 [Proteobacteria bacterium]|nr:hypothetical protein [Pseudomonadota bacterium]
MSKEDRQRVLQYALLCRYLYDQVYLPSDWSLLPISAELKSKYPAREVEVLQKRQGEVAIVFKGISPTEFKDIQKSLSHALGGRPPSFDQAVSFVRQVKNHLESKKGTLFCCRRQKIVVIGHSIGGAVAEWVSFNLKLEAYTFDSPGCGVEIKKGDCYNFLSDPNLINTCKPHYGEVYFVRQEKDPHYLETLRKKLAEYSQTLSDFSSEYSWGKVSDGKENKWINFFKKKTGQVIKKTIDHWVGLTLINHTLYTHKLSYMISMLENPKPASIAIVRQWPKLIDLMRVIGVDPAQFPTNLEEIGRFLEQLGHITDHVADLDTKLIQLIQTGPLESSLHKPVNCLIL